MTGGDGSAGNRDFTEHHLPMVINRRNILGGQNTAPSQEKQQR